MKMLNGIIEKKAKAITKTRQAVDNTLKLFSDTIDELKTHKAALEAHANEHDEVAASLSTEAAKLRNEADSINTVLGNITALFTRK
jgi:FtsZ-binding cell division protein ZapB